MIVRMQGSTLTTMKASSYPWPYHWSLWWSAGASIIIDIVVVMIFIIIIIVIIISMILILITRKKEGNLCRVVTTGVSKETVEVSRDTSMNHTLRMKLTILILIGAPPSSPLIIWSLVHQHGQTTSVEWSDMMMTLMTLIMIMMNMMMVMILRMVITMVTRFTISMQSLPSVASKQQLLAAFLLVEASLARPPWRWSTR